MALTVVKYRKTSGGTTTATPAVIVRNKVQSQPQIIKKPIIKLEGTELFLNKIPAVIKSTMKRANTISSDQAYKSPRFMLQAVGSNNTPLSNYQWQETSSAVDIKKEQLGAAISSLPPNTIIKATTRPANYTSNETMSNNAATYVQHNGLTPASQTISTTQVRPTFYIKRENPKRTIRSITLELIEKNPSEHLGIALNRLPMLKNIICKTANVTHIDCYLTLKKLRQNESFSLLAEYFELTESEAGQIFARTVTKMSRYLRYLIRWPESKRYYDRHKHLPFAYRANLYHVQSMIECVETDIDSVFNIGCSSYKYILSINTNGVISYVSEAYRGDCDDLMLFDAANFKNVIPKYLSLVVEPGKAVRRRRKMKAGREIIEIDSTTDSADESIDDVVIEDTQPISSYDMHRVVGEIASSHSLNIVEGELTSCRAKNLSIPTTQIRESICRDQIRHMIDKIREFRILQPCAIQQTIIFEYLNEILVVTAALTNLLQ